MPENLSPQAGGRGGLCVTSGTPGGKGGACGFGWAHDGLGGGFTRDGGPPLGGGKEGVCWLGGIKGSFPGPFGMSGDMWPQKGVFFLCVYL